MASSGSFNTTAYSTSGGNRYLTFTWNETGCSIENNTRTISYTFKASGTYSGWIYGRNIELVVNGITVYSQAGPIKLYNGTVLKSGTVPIKHDSDGTKNFSASAKAGIYTSAVNCTGSGLFTLDTIPRKSTVKATNGNIGAATTITISRASSNFTHTLTWKCGALSGTFATKTTATSLSATIPTSIYSLIPNAKTATVTVTCETFNGNTSLGTSSCTFTATANESTCKPTVSATSLEDINAKTIAITGNAQKMIKGVSNAQISGAAATAKNGATLKSLVFKCKDKSVNVSNGTAVISSVMSGEFTLTATDSRGYSNTLTYTREIYDYSKPTIIAQAFRPTQTGSEIQAEYSGKYSIGVPNNIISVYYRYSENGGAYTEWISLTPTVSGNSFSGALTLNDLDYRNEYKFEFRVADLLNSVIYPVTVVRGVPIFDWGEEDFNFNVPIKYGNTNKLIFTPGDTFTLKNNDFASAAYVTGATRNLYVQIPVSKPICANAVTGEGKIIARGINGYLNGTIFENSAILLSGGSGYSVSYKITEIGIRIAFAFSNEIPNAINNTPVAVTANGEITFTFS